MPGVAQSHHGPVVRPGRHNQVRGHARPLDDQRVVPGRLERFGDPREHTRIIVMYPCGLAVRRLVANDLGAEYLPDALMSKAHAEDGDATAELPHRIV